jgi:hypothetical protein
MERKKIPTVSKESPAVLGHRRKSCDYQTCWQEYTINLIFLDLVQQVGGWKRESYTYGGC